MESKPVEFRHSPACCKSQNACLAIRLNLRGEGGDGFVNPLLYGQGIF